MTTEQRVKISWSVITFVVTVVFTAGILVASVQNLREDLRSQTYSHEDGKLLEYKITSLQGEVSQLKDQTTELNRKLDALQSYLMTGKMPKSWSALQH